MYKKLIIGIITLICFSLPASQIQASPDGCCGIFTYDHTGNTNCGVDGYRNLADVTRLIDNVYISKQELCCEENGNVNGDSGGLLNLADITRLIDHIYISKAETAYCL